MARFLLLSGLLFGLLQVCVSNPLVVKRWDDLELRHSWSEIPRGWELMGPAPADHNLEMRIGLKQDRIDELISTLYQVSDPAHEKYRLRQSSRP
jgi:tripeptidyl-peptidase-1